MKRTRVLDRTQRMPRPRREFLTDRPECPRCGYDLRGQTCLWNVDEPAEGSGCPLQGRCNECGLEFAWTDVFHPRRAYQWWFIENVAIVRIPISALMTWLYALLIWPFWRGVRLENPIRLHRAWGWAVGVTLLALSSRFAIEVAYTWKRDLLLAVESVYSIWASQFGPDFHLPIWLLGGTAACVAAPMVFALLPFSRARSKVRMRHVFRAWAYSLLWLPTVALSSTVNFANAVLFLPAGWQAQDVMIDPLRFLTGAGWVDWYGLPAEAVVPLWPTLIWLSIFWLFALRTGFRMKDWLPVWLSMVAVAWICGCLAGMGDERFLRGWN